jgi:hypothetical protein
MKTKALAGLGALLCLGPAGCDSNPVGGAPFQVPVVAWNDDGDYLHHRAGEGLVADEQSPIPDVPKPIGFKPVKSRCGSSFDGIARTVTHVYQGRADTPETALFYRQQLPFYDWQRVEVQIHEDEATTMHYAKGAEALAVRLSDRHGTATIEVYITPR